MISHKWGASAMISFKGSGLRLTTEGLQNAANKAGVEVASLEAVMAVESGKHGFDSLSRPVILFEPHVFYRLLKANDPSQLTRAVEAGVAYPTWGQHPYPKDSYPHFAAAITIDEGHAISATSVGLAQILGENYKLAGYATPQDFWDAALQGEDTQILMMANFLIGTGLNHKLAAKDWAGFARGYNGPGYARNHYDSLLSHWYTVKKSEAAPEPPKPILKPVKMPEPGPVAINLPANLSAAAPQAPSPTTHQTTQPPAPEASTDLEAKIDAAIHEVIAAAIEANQARPTQPEATPPVKIHVPSMEELIQQLSKVTK
jgi:hypothetical protein